MNQQQTITAIPILELQQLINTHISGTPVRIEQIQEVVSGNQHINIYYNNLLLCTFHGIVIADIRTSVRLRHAIADLLRLRGAPLPQS